MKKLELLRRANRFYPDGALETYFDQEGNLVPDEAGGDGLARFIVTELTEAVDFSQPSIIILDEAKKCIHTAMGDLLSVLAGLDDCVNWRGQERPFEPDCRWCNHLAWSGGSGSCELGIRDRYTCTNFADCR